jgi:hypothetical protein
MRSLLLAIVVGCGGVTDPAECPPGHLDLGLELDGMCSARGVTPVLDRCSCSEGEGLLCQGEGQNTYEVTTSLRGGFGTADVTALAPTLETLGTARVLCWSRYIVEVRP